MMSTFTFFSSNIFAEDHDQLLYWWFHNLQEEIKDEIPEMNVEIGHFLHNLQPMTEMAHFKVSCSHI